METNLLPWDETYQKILSHRTYSSVADITFANTHITPFLSVSSYSLPEQLRAKVEVQRARYAHMHRALLFDSPSLDEDDREMQVEMSAPSSTSALGQTPARRKQPKSQYPNSRATAVSIKKCSRPRKTIDTQRSLKRKILVVRWLSCSVDVMVFWIAVSAGSADVLSPEYYPMSFPFRFV